MTNWPLAKRSAGSRVVRNENRLSVQCWTQVTVSTKKAPPAFTGAATGAKATSFIGVSTLFQAASNVAADIRRGARGSGDMDAALGLVLPRPAAGADVLTVFHRLGAGPAADRGE